MIKRHITLLFISILSFSSVFGQKYFTRNGEVNFFSATPLENIEAQNNQASCIVDIATGQVVSKILIEAFQFKKALMQEHFNENYMESDKYPVATLKAQILNLESIDFTNAQNQQIKLTGTLSIHNVSQAVTIEGIFNLSNESLKTEAKFIVKPEDYNIKIPKAVKDNIAKEIEVSISFDLKPFNN